MKHLYAVLLVLLLSGTAHAAMLTWDAANVGPLTIERGAALEGPFSVIATVPIGTTRYMLLPGAWGFYRVTGAGTISNVVQFSLDLYTGSVTDRLDALEAKFAALALPSVSTGSTVVLTTPPISASALLTTRQIDSTHVELTCAGTSMRTTGSGLRRIVECLP